MKTIIVGRTGSGKTTLLHNLIRTGNNFAFIFDGIDFSKNPDILNDFADIDNVVVVSQNLEDIPEKFRMNALILNTDSIFWKPRFSSS